MKNLCFGLVAIFIVACNGQEQPNKVNTSQLESLGRAYIKSYNERDLMAWDTFYADSAVIHDRMSGLTLKGRGEVLNFIRPVFEGLVPMYANIKWSIEDIATNDRSIVIKGTLSGVRLGDTTLPPWRFVTWIVVDEANRFLVQEDYVAYPPELLQASSQ